MWKRTMMSINIYSNDMLQRRIRNKMNPSVCVFFLLVVYWYFMLPNTAKIEHGLSEAVL